MDIFRLILNEFSDRRFRSWLGWVGHLCTVITAHNFIGSRRMCFGIFILFYNMSQTNLHSFLIYVEDLSGGHNLSLGRVTYGQHCFANHCRFLLVYPIHDSKGKDSNALQIHAWHRVSALRLVGQLKFQQSRTRRMSSDICNEMSFSFKQ